jgi:hypothetical protein
VPGHEGGIKAMRAWCRGWWDPLVTRLKIWHSVLEILGHGGVERAGMAGAIIGVFICFTFGVSAKEKKTVLSRLDTLWGFMMFVQGTHDVTW